MSTRDHVKILPWWSGVLIFMLAAPGHAADPPLDVRIAIDVSGSMKQNDPDNLRRPSLRLLAGLLPNGVQAGVWLFSQNTTPLIPLGKVDEAWKERARRAANAVHSRGLFTHIEDVLGRASADWNKPAPPGTQRHILLLTDGMVDVSKNADESAASRVRILEQQLPHLHELGAKIHTIALSDRADHVLLRRLSQTSGGWYEQVRTAGALQRVFMHLFEKVGNPDTLPFKDNRFRVDATIQEVTLIIFRPEGSPATRLLNPSGAEIGPENGAAAGVTWHQDQGYDLLTLRAPAPGEWRVRAAADPDNRVLILTDLRMEVSPIPNRLLGGEGVPLSVGFLDQGKPVTRQELLDVVQVQAEQIGPDDTRGGPGVLRDDGQGEDKIAYDGKFQTRFMPVGQSGRAELVVTAQSKTFQREKRNVFELAWPVRAILLPVFDAPHLRLRVIPEPDLFAAGSLDVSAELTTTPPTPLPLSPIAEGAFEGKLDLTQFGGTVNINVQVKARTAAGANFSSTLPPLAVQGQGAAPVAASPAHSSTPAPESAPEEHADAAPAESSSSMKMLGFIAAHVILIGGGGLGYWWWRRRRQNAPDPLNLIDEAGNGENLAS